MTVKRDRTEHPEQPIGWQYCKKAKPNERGRLKTAARKVRMRWLDHVVKADDYMLKLRADTANEPVHEWRHLAEQYYRAWLGASIRLRKRRERHITLSHGMRSATLYSGSSSP